MRTIEREDGKILFCANDVAKMLGYTNPNDAIIKHCKSDGIAICEGVVKTGLRKDGTTYEQVDKLKFITEGNVYRLIIRSQLPTAEKFESWIFDEVIPSIRKKGYYGKIDRTEEPNFLTRYKANDNRIPRTHFSVISQLYLILNREFEYHGYIIPYTFTLDMFDEAVKVFLSPVLHLIELFPIFSPLSLHSNKRTVVEMPP